MESEEAYFRQVTKTGTFGGYGTDQAVVSPSTIADEAAKALSAADGLHSMLDDLEHRLFGPEPRGVSVESQKQAERPALAHTIKGTRQRLDSAADRVSRILSRL